MGRKAQRVRIPERVSIHLKPGVIDQRKEIGHWEGDTLGMNTYFADPYSAWQREGNENINLWIRYYFPKGTDFAKISEEDIKDVEWELNNRPRKRLGFKTPMAGFSKYLRGCTSS